MKRIPPDMERAIVREWRGGERSTVALGARHGIHDSTIRNVLRRNDCGPIVRPSFKRRTTAEQDREIVRLYQEGRSANQIAVAFGLTQMSILKRVHEAGVTPHSKGTRKPLSSEEAAEVLRLRAEGRGVVEIGKMLGIGYPRIRSCLQESGQPTWTLVGRNQQTTGEGYVLHPVEASDEFAVMANGRGYVLGHRLVMARSLGRPLARGETVHHVNGDKADNRIENLQLRQGKHGNGASFTCLDCGSHNVAATPLRSVPDA